MAKFTLISPRITAHALGFLAYWLANGGIYVHMNALYKPSRLIKLLSCVKKHFLTQWIVLQGKNRMLVLHKMVSTALK